MTGGGTAIAEHVNVILFPGEADVLVGLIENLGEPAVEKKQGILYTSKYNTKYMLGNYNSKLNNKIKVIHNL